MSNVKCFVLFKTFELIIINIINDYFFFFFFILYVFGFWPLVCINRSIALWYTCIATGRIMFCVFSFIIICFIHSSNMNTPSESKKKKNREKDMFFFHYNFTFLSAIDLVFDAIPFSEYYYYYRHSAMHSLSAFTRTK